MPDGPSRGGESARDRAAAPADLGRQLENRIRTIEDQIADIEDNLRYSEAELRSEFPGSPELVARAGEACRAWRTAISEKARPALRQLRAALAERRDPAHSLALLEELQAAAATYHEVVLDLRQAAQSPEATREVGLLSVLMGESGANILGDWSQIRWETDAIARLCREATASRE